VTNQSDDSGARDVIVVGAGAAGLAAAIFARRFNPALPVLLLDGAVKPGAKILVSGGSRCNVTNRSVDERDFWGGHAVIIRKVLRAFSSADTIDWFRGLGVGLHEEPDGKMFPDTNRSRDVLEALLREVSTRGATLAAGHRVVDIRRHDRGFLVETTRGTRTADAVVVAAGGRSLPKTGSDGGAYDIVQRLGHSLVPTTPALAPLVLDDRQSMHRDVAGVSQDVSLAVWVDGAIQTRLEGSLLWTHIGASGPVAMNASRHWHRAQLEGRPVAITVNFSPPATFDDVDARIQRLAQQSPRMTTQSMMSRFVPASVATAMLRRLAMDSTAQLAHLGREERRRLTRALVEWPLAVTATRGYNFAEATAGGVALDEINPASMESRVCPGLFLAGEVLDVDGRIGGFNFQWAWSSGFVAGRALARRG
jgi:predicted Rossmann fold flavoprotein